MTKKSHKSSNKIRTQKGFFIKLGYLVGLIVVFIILGLLAFNGNFSKIFEHDNHYSKEYVVKYNILVNREGNTFTMQENQDFMSLGGDVDLFTSSLSAENPITVKANLALNQGSSDANLKTLWDDLPLTLDLKFENAFLTSSMSNQNNERLPAIINLTKSNETFSYVGTGNIEYMTEGSYSFGIDSPVVAHPDSSGKITLFYPDTLSGKKIPPVLIETEDSMNKKIDVKPAEDFVGVYYGNLGIGIAFFIAVGLTGFELLKVILRYKGLTR